MKRFALIFCVSILFGISITQLQADTGKPSAPQDRNSALNAIQLVPVVTSGLTASVFVTHAGDGTNRLFILERGGRIRLYKNGSLVVTPFLNISSLVRSTENGGGGEQGLLGLAFHPNYPATPYFYVYYTGITNGVLTLAQYQVSVDSDIADSASATIFLTIPHASFTNHNGGMIAFGPDNFLYLGIGDGGSGNDPGNNGQNLADRVNGREELLGKILRINVDTPNAPLQYSSPATNPFFGGSTHDDEIYAYGIRNPWRFSFDRGGTNQLYLGDVGQGAREEIDIVINGGNYGWRVYEGNSCTGNDPGLCNPANYLFPIAEYTHVSGRCSLTGGYVYRGPGGVFANGAYIYGDYCTGEIFQLVGTTQTLLLDDPAFPSFNLASFGEDEAGEIYVVRLSGAIYRLGNCSAAILPTDRSIDANATTGSVSVTAASSCGWTVASNALWITVTSSANGIGNGTVNYSVAANTGAARSGTITIGNQTFTINQAASPTAVDLISFHAIADESSTTFKWQTGFEADNLGFRIWRDDGGKRTLINQQLIAGSALKTASPLTAGESYAWTDSTIANPQNASYWLEDVDLAGVSTWHGPFTVEKAGAENQESNDKQSPARTLEQLSNNQRESSRVVERVADISRLNNAAQSQPISIASQKAISRLQTPDSRLQTLKIAVKREGWYRLTAEELFAAGLRRDVDLQTLQLFADEREIPILISKPEEAAKSPFTLSSLHPFPASAAEWTIEFYGLGIDTPSTDTHAYWLVQGNVAGKRLRQSKGGGVSSSSQSFTQTIERRDRQTYFAALLNGEKENFFGAVVTNSPLAQTLTVQHLANDSEAQAEIAITLQGVTLQAHRVLVQLNNQELGFVTFDGQQQGRGRFFAPHALLREGDNTVQLISQNGASDVSLVDAIRISYRHTFDADNDALKLTAPAGEAITINGFSSRAIRVFDVTDANEVHELIGTIADAKTGGFAITVAAQGGGERTLLALADNHMKRPEAIRAAPASTLSQNAEFLIITARSFFSALEPLKKQRQTDGLQTALIDIEDIYDEYSFGNKSPQAIKDFLAAAVANRQLKPRFVLLAGDASYDARNYLGFGGSDIVPTRLLDTAFLETASDDWFSDFNNDGVGDLATGRLPSRSLDEAAAMVTKILRYATTKTPDSALLVSDVNDGFDFEQASAQLRNLLPSRIKAAELKRGQVDAETAKRNLLAALTRGEKLVNYVGHGSVNLWRGGLLTAEEARSLQNEQLPFFILMNCLNGYYTDAAGEALGEALLKAERGGAVAVWASSGLTDPTAQALMNQELYRALFAKRGVPLGEAIRRAKAAINDSDIRRTWILLGDPTLQLK